jgi:hypothetical protein
MLKVNGFGLWRKNMKDENISDEEEERPEWDWLKKHG